MKSSSNTIATMTLLICAAAITAPAQTFTTLADLPGSPGYEMSMVQGRDGNLYGTTYNGGVNNEGTFFKVTQTER